MTPLKFIISGIVTLLLFILNIYIGAVDIPVTAVTDILLGNVSEESPLRFIIIGSRLPQAVTAMLAGSALTVSGLLLQSAFRNPLAGPSILGISSGAGLGVAFVMLLLGGSVSAVGFSWGGYTAILIGAFAGSIAVMALLLLFSTWLKNDMMLLITGIMVGYLTSSIITLLNYTSTAEGIQSYTLWGMGNFNSVSLGQLPLFAGIVALGLLTSLMLAKPLNIILLGYTYAHSLGVNVRRVRNVLLLSTGVLTAVVTAYCGPVSFIGLAVPHIVRMIFRVADHRIILPGCVIIGALIGLLCNLMCLIPDNMLLPLNGVTPLIGVPVILYVIFKRRKLNA
ncbi:MAG: iron ABC transporter permease [Muribaculaceae bacterium]|nr:iron ABC transporter permease [Muribaculaceae bacterium]